VSLPRLVVFVEGKGDKVAVPKLTSRLVSAVAGFEILSVDPEPFVVHNLGTLVRDECKEWKRLLEAAFKTRRTLAGVLLVLDGDLKKVPSTWKSYVDRFGNEFCAHKIAACLAERAREVRGGEAFSVAVVFAMREFESWILAGIDGVHGVHLAGERGRVANDLAYPGVVSELTRNSKGLLKEMIPEYKESLDQAVLASKLDLQLAKERSRSFRRMASAVDQLVGAVRTGKPTATPAMPHQSGIK
jgi:hypothetical protein